MQVLKNSQRAVFDGLFLHVIFFSFLKFSLFRVKRISRRHTIEKDRPYGTKRTNIYHDCQQAPSSSLLLSFSKSYIIKQQKP